MALYDAPVERGYKVLTHSSHPLFSKNGFKQVGNTTIPANPISANRVGPSAIYNKNISGVKGISEAGYGQRYPFHGLSYSGAGSPRSSLYRPGLSYSGAGSYPAGLSYAGAGSPSSSIYRPGLSYAGAGSPRRSVLSDAYINDNPPPGTLKPLSGLRDDTAVPVDSGTTYGPSIPGTSPAQSVDSSGGFLTSLENAFGSIFATSVATGTTAAQLSVANAITGAAAPSTSKPPVTTIAGVPISKTEIFGLSTTTLLLVGVGAYLYLKK